MFVCCWIPATDSAFMPRTYAPGHVSTRKPMVERAAAALCCVIAMTLAVAPGPVWRSTYPEYAATLHEDAGKFCRRNYNKLISTGSVMDIKHAGHPPDIPDSIAMLASTMFKQGYYRKRYISVASNRTELVRQWWTSIKMACRECQALRNICEFYNCSPHKVLRAMKRVDPRLKYRLVDIKMHLSAKQRRARITAANRLISKFEADTTFLQRVYWIDECAIWLSDLVEGGTKVWCDAHDKNVHEVIPCKWLVDGQDVKLHFICAVNWVEGPMYIEMTTGTTKPVHRDTFFLLAPYHVSVGV